MKGIIRKDIFLSHSHKDKVFVRQLAASLERSGLSCWIDEAELNVGDSIIKRIGEGIYESSFVAAVISKNSVTSPWVQKELQMAMTREISGQRICVLPIIIDKCTALLPYFLRDKLYADFRKPEKYQKTVDSLVRAIGKPSNIKAHEAALVGEVDIGTVIHDRGREFYGLRSTRFMERNAMFIASVGVF